MKNLILTLLLLVISSTMLTANEQDTLWLRTTTSGVIDLDFTPDDKYVIAWTNSIEFWNVETATMDYILPNIKVGGMTPDEKYLVFIQDGVPKMLDIETKEIIEGFEPPTFKPNHVKVGNDNNIFMCFNEKDSLFIWNIETKQIEKIFSVETDFIENGEGFVREITDYGFAGNNDDFLFVRIREQDKLSWQHPDKVLRGASMFYNREDLTLFDSLEVIYNYKTMNLNKDVIAIDNKDGSIDFYDIRIKSNISSISRKDFSKVNDIEFTEDDDFMSLTYGEYAKVFNLQTNDEFASFNVGTYGQFKLSNNRNYSIGSVGSFLILHPSVLTSIDDRYIESTKEIRITPNPSNHLIQIAYDFTQFSSYKFCLYDISGSLITIIDDGYSSSLGYSKEYNISSLPTGAYFIKLEYDGAVVNKQFIKE